MKLSLCCLQSLVLKGIPIKICACICVTVSTVSLPFKCQLNPKRTADIKKALCTCIYIYHSQLII